MENVGFMANIIENHDEPRGVSRFLPEYAQNEMGKKLLATTSILLRGIPFIFQGQEIGMTNCLRTDISEYNDINTVDQYYVAMTAGFMTGRPWLGVNEKHWKTIFLLTIVTMRKMVRRFWWQVIMVKKRIPLA